MYTERHEADKKHEEWHGVACKKCGRFFKLPEEELALKNGECPGPDEDDAS